MRHSLCSFHFDLCGANTVHHRAIAVEKLVPFELEWLIVTRNACIGSTGSLVAFLQKLQHLFEFVRALLILPGRSLEQQSGEGKVGASDSHEVRASVFGTGLLADSTQISKVVLTKLEISLSLQIGKCLLDAREIKQHKACEIVTSCDFELQTPPTDVSTIVQAACWIRS